MILTGDIKNTWFVNLEIKVFEYDNMFPFLNNFCLKLIDLEIFQHIL
jgi:hypothetical protein